MIKDVIKDKDILQESVTSLHSRNIELKTEKNKVSFEIFNFSVTALKDKYHPSLQYLCICYLKYCLLSFGGLDFMFQSL